jgi:hypothetical protein
MSRDRVRNLERDGLAGLRRVSDQVEAYVGLLIFDQLGENGIHFIWCFIVSTMPCLKNSFHRFNAGNG